MSTITVIELNNPLKNRLYIDMAETICTIEFYIEKIKVLIGYKLYTMWECGFSHGSYS